MGILQNKIDFVAFVTASMANANGDPLNGNRPRIDYEGNGEISDVCIKRKLRNRMQDLGENTFVQSDDRCADSYDSLKSRAIGELGEPKDDSFEGKREYAKNACEKWLDVRSFGQVLAFKLNKKEKKKSSDDENTKDKGCSIGIRGPVSIHQAVSVDPIEVHSMQITKSVNGEPAENRSSDTMGLKHFVRFGLYKIKGSINVQLAEKTGFTEEDAEVIKECLKTLFENDASSARPEGSMEVCRLYWWKHNNKSGQYSTAQVHRSVNAVLKNKDKMPDSFEDYEIIENKLDGLKPEVYELC
ncbi:MAG: type I-C CRISPR-associated protein Cas7/Csd2 [Acidaminococcaceae bacterium]|nr:type I-C CRISPR-associated protein Cas7/Csd2 [Acidaminococcaceae bacterium]